MFDEIFWSFTKKFVMLISCSNWLMFVNVLLETFLSMLVSLNTFTTDLEAIIGHYLFKISRTDILVLFFGCSLAIKSLQKYIIFRDFLSFLTGLKMLYGILSKCPRVSSMT